MASKKNDNQTDQAWDSVLSDGRIQRALSEEGICEVEAKDIKKYREPRLMTKHDTSSGVPEPLRNRKLNVLPVSRHSYAVGQFEVFRSFPSSDSFDKPQLISLPDYETLDADDIRSESAAINALVVSGALADFLHEDNLVATFNGRRGTGSFSFAIDRRGGGSYTIDVDRAQLEIDGGFETDDSVIIVEAKNIIHPDFNVRQLYFPYRLYRELVDKPIRLVFSQYTNSTYRLYEYEFEDEYNYSSISLVRSKAYSFEDSRISATELEELAKRTPIVADDCGSRAYVPFPQANKFEYIISLMEFADGKGGLLSTEEVREFLGYTQRQANYYPTAGRYLGVFEASARGYVSLTQRGEGILRCARRDRMLALAGLLFEHRIFNELFCSLFRTGVFPSKKEIVEKMVCLGFTESRVTLGRVTYNFLRTLTAG